MNASRSRMRLRRCTSRTGFSFSTRSAIMQKAPDGAFCILAERVGFEPTVRGYRTPDFESGSFDHSDTSPLPKVVRPLFTKRGLTPFCWVLRLGRYWEAIRCLSSAQSDYFGAIIGAWEGRTAFARDCYIFDGSTNRHVFEPSAVVGSGARNGRTPCRYSRQSYCLYHQPGWSVGAGV